VRKPFTGAYRVPSPVYTSRRCGKKTKKKTVETRALPGRERGDEGTRK